jgi:hypothetical protein
MIFNTEVLLLALLLSSSPTPPAAEFPLTLAETTIDVTGDGNADRIAVLMTGGRRYVDEPWCGGGDKHEGHFAISVHVAGGPRVDHDLNRLMAIGPGPKSIFFPARPWKLAFADYNGDGRLDFNIGRYGTCSGWEYRLFTVNHAGAVTALPLPDGALYVHDHVPSSDRIRPVGGVITLETYNNATSEWREVSYSWNARQGVFLRTGERFLRRQE